MVKSRIYLRPRKNHIKASLFKQTGTFHSKCKRHLLTIKKAVFKNKTVLTLPKLIQTILKGSLTNFSDSKVVSGLNVTGNAFGKKRKLIESDHLRSLLQFVRDDLYPKNIVNLNGVPYYATTLKDTLRIKKTAKRIFGKRPGHVR